MSDLDRIERKLDLILHILGEGRKSYDLEQEAKNVIKMKLNRKPKKSIMENGSAKKG